MDFIDIMLTILVLCLLGYFFVLSPLAEELKYRDDIREKFCNKYQLNLTDVKSGYYCVNVSSGIERQIHCDKNDECYFISTENLSELNNGTAKDSKEKNE